MKFCIISFGFNESNHRLQPWNYTYQLAKCMILFGHEVYILTNHSTSKFSCEIFEGITLMRTNLFNITQLMNRQKLYDLFSDLNVDVIFWPVGPTNFYQIPIIRNIPTPVVGIFFGPLHSLNEFKKINPLELLRNKKYVIIPLISAFMPNYIFKKLLMVEKLKSIIVINSNAKRELLKFNLNKPIHIFPPALTQRKNKIDNMNENNDLRKKHLLNSNFVLLYFGSPLTIRGLDLVIKAVALLKNKIPEIRLVILSRKRNNYDAEELYIRKLIKELDVASEVTIVSGFLSPNQVTEYISISNCITLPFKFLQADMPLSILESLELNKIVISTNVGGISDWLNKNGLLIEPNNLLEIKEAILYIYNNPEWIKMKEKEINCYISHYPSWEDLSKKIIEMTVGLI